MNLIISDIIQKALDGGELDASELRELFAVHHLSAESYLIQQAGRQMSEKASNGKAEIHGQVGINSGICPRNCEFCSFAEVNGIFHESVERSVEEVAAGALDFESAGANAIYLMATAMYKLDDYLKMGSEIRKILKPETPLIANFGDIDEEGAKALKDCGFNGIYHAIRLGEGVHTQLDPQERWRTVEAAQKVGLAIGTCLEPVGPEHSIDELVEKTLLIRRMKPVYSGTGRRIPIPNTAMAAHGIMSYARMAPIVAIVRLAMGYGVIGNATHEPHGVGAMAGANLLWAERGANPRDTAAETVRGWSVDATREVFFEAGWEVLDGPSAMYCPG